MYKVLVTAITTFFLYSSTLIADDFALSFEWGDIPLCTSGSPNTVPNPRFELSNVPEGTKYVFFKIVDKDVPNYNHGGGKVKYEGESVIEPGAFTYKSPCPPNGSHTYEWTATAKSKKSSFGGKLGKARTSVKYP